MVTMTELAGKIVPLKAGNMAATLKARRLRLLEPEDTCNAYRPNQHTGKDGIQKLEFR